MAETTNPNTVLIEGGVVGESFVGFPNGVDSFSHPLAVKPLQLRWLENGVTQGALPQVRPGFKTRLECSVTDEDSEFYSWYEEAGRPVIHPQMMEEFVPSNGGPQLVFAISGSVWWAPVSPDGAIGIPTQIKSLQFDKNADIITGTRCTQTATIVSGKLANNILPRNLIVLQDGINRSGIWDGLSGQKMNPTKHITLDEDDSTLYTNGFNETRIGLWCAFSGGRLFVFNGRLGFASDLGDPTHFTEELRFDSFPVILFPDVVTGAIDRGTSGNTRSQVIVCTRRTTHTIWSGVLSRFPTDTSAGWAFTSDFVSTIFKGVGCVAGKSMIVHRGLLYWKSIDGLVLFDSTGTVNSTQNLPIIDQEMAYSKRLVAPSLSHGSDLTCAGIRGSYVFWSVPVGPVTRGRCYNSHTQVLDRQTTVVRSVGDSGPFSYGTTGWQGIWTGIRPVAWTNVPSGSLDRTYALSLDGDGVVRIWEAFQGNRADNGHQIPWTMETRLHRVAPSVFNYSNFKYFRLLLDQIKGNVNVRGYWRGMRSKYHELLNVDITATPGSVFTPIPGGGTVANDTRVENYSVQSRDVVSKNVLGPGDDCQAVGVESEYRDDKDHAFSLLFKLTGRAAVSAYRIVADQVADNTQGRAVNNTGVSENGFNIVSPTSCPRHIEGETPDYLLVDSPIQDAFSPVLPVVVESTPYQAPTP